MGAMRRNFRSKPADGLPPKQVVAEAKEMVEMADTEKEQDSVSEDEQPRLTMQQVLQFASSSLTLFERKEILAYPEVFCIGRHAKKTYEHPHNRGFDSESRSYCVVMRDHVAYRYEVLRLIGTGYSSKVYKAYDHKTRTVVALKCFRNDQTCRNLALNEIDLLQHLNRLEVESGKSTNIIRLLDSFVFRKHHFIVLELLADTLYDFMKRLPAEKKRFDVSIVLAFAKSLLRPLVLLANETIVHGDVKPENLVLRDVKKSGLKLIDFGTSCREGATIHDYYQTRFYRAPEVVLGMKYGTPIDMWSFGCVLAELATGKPLFPGRYEPELMWRMIEILDVPPEHMCQLAKPQQFANHFHPDGTPKYWPRPPESASAGETACYGPPGSRTLRAALGDAAVNDHFVDFLQRCLTWDPLKRMTPAQAADHPWIKAETVRSTNGK